MSRAKKETFFTGLKRSYEGNNSNVHYNIHSSESNTETAGSDLKQMYRQIDSLRYRHSSASMQFKLFFVFIPNIINLIENIILLAITIPIFILKTLYNAPSLLKMLKALTGQVTTLTDDQNHSVTDLVDTAACLKLETIAIGLNIANTILAVLSIIVRGLGTVLTLSYKKDREREHDRKIEFMDEAIVTDAKNTLKGPVENYLIDRTNRFFSEVASRANTSDVTHVQQHKFK